VTPRTQAGADEAPAFLIDQPAGSSERRRAALVLGVSAALFCALAPFAQRKLAAVAAFIPIYESALVLLDLITAVLLFGQYRILRSGALLLLGSGYLFTAVMAAGHALTFPGLFAPEGLLGAGPQSTAWIYMFWHAGFPLFVVGYALLGRRPAAGAWGVGLPLFAVLMAIGALALATAGQASLPPIMQDNHYTSSMRAVVVSVWLFSLGALVALWRRRPHSVLDLWLTVVVIAWLFDIALSAMLNAGRFDLGFYAGRIYGIVACGVVLFELLLENGMLYARLVELHGQEHARSVELAAARDAAQAANGAKSLFLASISHEIRTPMNAIIGLTQLVLQTRLDESQRDCLSKVQTSSKALLGLLNDILDYSKIEAGKVALEREEFDAEETIENVGNLFSARIEEAGLDLFFEIDENVPRRLVGDALRLAQVLNNLVGNAIKFTPRGEVVVAVELAGRTDSEVELRFSVRDTGIGLTPAQAERLFQPFTQADRTIARRFGGTGLGLAICKRLVEMMGGTMSVQSTEGVGSTFSFNARFELPTAQVERLDLQRIRGMHALVVDGQPTARLILQQVLQSWRFQVGTASFADEALFKLRRADPGAPYELLLVDWKSAGPHFIGEAMRLQAQLNAPPLALIVMVSPHGSDSAQQALRAWPAAVTLVKPVTPSRLFDTVLRLQHGEGGRAVEAPGSADFMEGLKPLRGARVLLAEDNPVNQQVAVAFLTMAGLQVTVADNGLQAVEWVRKADFDVVLMDMQMPEMDGPQATRLIRTLPQGARLPVIAMTAAAMEEDKQECLAAGMNAHVSKPIDPKELVRTLLAKVPVQPQRAASNDLA
jgi:signal transduction histidine kinase/CheY-like chemotaxis protein